MRDRDAYLAQGRSDPLREQQLGEHPYDFVSLPSQPSRGEACTHDLCPKDRWSGLLQLAYRTLSPLHIGSGVFDTAEECGLEGGTRPVRGIVRRQGRPVLPGSSWKGAVRAYFEAITRSRLGVASTQHNLHANKLPEALRKGPSKHFLKIQDRKVQNLIPCQKNLRYESIGDLNRKLAKLSPAEALFGCPGYRARLHPGEGTIEGPAADKPLKVVPMESPAAHRMAKPGKARPDGPGRIAIQQVEGRKFYYDGEIVPSRTTAGANRESFEHLDFVAPGSTIRIDVHLQSITQAELGALLIAGGFEGAVGVFRLGGYKPAGLGALSLEQVQGRLWKGSSIRRRRGADSPQLDIDAALAAAHSGLIDEDALREIHEVTARRRP